VDRNYHTESEDPTVESSEKKSPDGMLVELAKKALVTSVTRILETEGFVREMVKAVTREVAGYVIREIEGLRQEVVEQAGSQLGSYLDRIDLAKEARKTLDGLSFDVNIKVKIKDDHVDVSSIKDGTTNRTAGKRKTV
jgi:hypothetical protein